MKAENSRRTSVAHSCRRKSRVARFAIATIVLLCGLHDGRCQPAKDRVDEILDAWTARAHSQKLVRCKMSGEMIWPKGGLSLLIPEPLLVPGRKSESPSRELRGKFTRGITIDFQTGRYRLEAQNDNISLSYESLFSQSCTRTFNGEESRETVDDHEMVKGRISPNLRIITGNPKARPIEREHWPIFAAFGVVRSGADWMLPGDFRPHSKRSDFYMVGDGAIDGTPCLVLRTYPSNSLYSEYWVDPNRDYAILRYLHCNDGGASETSDMKFKRVGNEWQPESWIWRRRDPRSGKVMQEQHCRIDDMQYPDSERSGEFGLEVKAKMVLRIIDVRNTGECPKSDDFKTSWCRVAESGERNTIVVVDGREYAASHSWIARWCILLMSFGLFTWIWQRRSGTKAGATRPV